jgi:hypothetical protein
MQQYDWTNNYGTKIYVPFEKFFKMKCGLDTGTWYPYAPDGCSHHPHPRHALPPPEKDEGTDLMTPVNDPRKKRGNHEGSDGFTKR